MKDMNWPERVAYLENQLADSDRDNKRLREFIEGLPDGDEIVRLRAGLQLIADDTHRLMNEVARQTAASILGGKPVGAAAQPSVSQSVVGHALPVPNGFGAGGLANWKPIESAPKDGRAVELAWIVNYPTVDYTAKSRWNGYHWAGRYTPTHWRHPVTASPTDAAP